MDEILGRYAADRLRVARHLETLAMAGEVRQLADGRYEAVTEPL